MTPEELKQITEKLEILFGSVSMRYINRIIQDIMRLFIKDGKPQIMPSTLFKLKMLKHAAELYNAILDMMNNDSDVSQVTDKAFVEAAKNISQQVNSDTKAAIDLINKDLPEDEKIETPTFSDKTEEALTKKELRVIDAEITKTKNDMTNLTRTTADAYQQTFISLCDEIYYKQRLGVDPNSAIVEGIKKAAESGLSTVTYTKNGRTIHTPVEVALARAVRTGINQTNAAVTLTRAAEMQVGYVKVSQHLGARVTKTNDFKNHSLWQGGIYSLDWNNPLLSQYKPTLTEEMENSEGFKYLNEMAEKEKVNNNYPDFIEKCGYGDVQGICGANCRHTFTLWYPDINIDTSKPIDPKENEDYYNATQKARAMERKIRAYKKKIAALKQAAAMAEGELKEKIRNEIKEATINLNNLAEEYRAFCRAYKIPQENWRLQI